MTDKTTATVDGLKAQATMETKTGATMLAIAQNYRDAAGMIEDVMRVAAEGDPKGQATRAELELGGAAIAGLMLQGAKDRERQLLGQLVVHMQHEKPLARK